VDRLGRQGIRVLDLTCSNPTILEFDYDIDLLTRALSRPGIALYEPDPRGSLKAREAVAGYYQSKGRRVSPDTILLTAGTSDAYAYLFKALANPGDVVLAPRPSYPLFEHLAALEGVRLRYYDLVYEGHWRVDLGSLEAAMDESVKAVLIVSPNNPTGSYLKRSELEQLSELCRERGLVLIVDEVFADYAVAPREDAVLSVAGWDQCVTVCLGGLSKTSGLPQLKLSWMAVSGPAEDQRVLLDGLEFVADAYLSVGTPVQLAAAELLAMRVSFQKQVRQRLEQNLQCLESAVSAHPNCTLLAPEGGWYAVVQLPRIRSEQEWVLGLLEEQHVLVQPGYFYDFRSEAFIVLSLILPPEVFRTGADRLFGYVESVTGS